MNRWVMPSGALVSDESISSPPNPWNVGYEYCTMLERELTLLQAGRAVGDAADFEATEHVWLNAAQGSREPDGSAVLYCSSENRYPFMTRSAPASVFLRPISRLRFAATQCHTRRPVLYRNTWMRPNGNEPALAATLYGPCEVKTDIAGTPCR